MNQVQHATRRGLLAGLAILPVTAVATPAPDLWAERERLFDAVGDAASEAEDDATFERMCAVEQTI